MVVLALIIINKAGGLIYNRTFAEGLNQLNTNDYLVLAGTFHGVHAITARLNPIKNRSSQQQFPGTLHHPQGSSGGGAHPGSNGGASHTTSTTTSSSHHPAMSPPTASAATVTAGGGGNGGGGTNGDGSSNNNNNGMLIRPEAPSGLEVMETENFRLQCFATQTGLKFLLFTDAVQASGPAADAAMRRIYEYYSDYVMKNPFYQLEMPVRCELFDRRLNSYIREINSSSR